MLALKGLKNVSWSFVKEYISRPQFKMELANIEVEKLNPIHVNKA